MSLMNLGTSLDMHFNLKIFACIAIINCLISFLLHVTILLVKALQLHLALCNWLTPHILNLYKPQIMLIVIESTLKTFTSM